MSQEIAQGTAHSVPDDLTQALLAQQDLVDLWSALTPLGRNEFICWIEDAKRPATRQTRIARTLEELAEGKKRPCCWAGCIHRSDKTPGAWQQAVLIDAKKSK